MRVPDKESESQREVVARGPIVQLQYFKWSENPAIRTKSGPGGTAFEIIEISGRFPPLPEGKLWQATL